MILKRDFTVSLVIILLVTSSCNSFFKRPDSSSDIDSSIAISDAKPTTSLIKEKSLMIEPEKPEIIFVHDKPTTIHVSPKGTGDGSSEVSPADLEHALLSKNVIAGDTILLYNGIYSGIFTSTITGNLANEITIKAKNAYQAIIDGGLQIGDLSSKRGAYTVVKNLRIYCSDTLRGKWDDSQGSNVRPVGIFNAAPHCKFINNIIHDGGIGIASQQKSEYSTIYGNIVFNSGAPDKVLGAAQNIYWQGLGKTIKHNVFAGGFKRTFNGFGTRAFIKDCDVVANVIFARNSALVGSIYNECDGIRFNDNHIIGEGNTMQIGYNYKYNGSCEIKRNRMYGKSYSSVQWWNNVEMSDNLIVQGELSANHGFYFVDDRTPDRYDWNFHHNKYHYLGPDPNSAFKVEYGEFGWGSWHEWNELGYDTLGSTFSTSKPALNELFVYPNEYPDPDDSRMGIVVIWNWEGREEIVVDLSSLGLDIGTTYRWRQAQDPLYDVGIWQCQGDSYTFSMAGHTVAKPIGFDEELVPSQFPTFGCFIIERL